MLPIRWNGSKGVVHFLVTTARKSLMVCACAAVPSSVRTHSAAASFLMIAFPWIPLFLVQSRHVASIARPKRTKSKPQRRPSRRIRSARHDLLVQFLIDDLHRAVDLGIGLAELMRNQL